MPFLIVALVFSALVLALLWLAQFHPIERGGDEQAEPKYGDFHTLE